MSLWAERWQRRHPGDVRRGIAYKYTLSCCCCLTLLPALSSSSAEALLIIAAHPLAPLGVGSLMH